MYIILDKVINKVYNIYIKLNKGETLWQQHLN